MALSEPAVRREVVGHDALRRGDHDFQDLLGIGTTLAKGAGQTIVVADPCSPCARRRRPPVQIASGRAAADHRFLFAGGCFGVFGEDAHPHSVEAIVPTTVVRYPRANIETALQARPQLALRLVRLAETEIERAYVQMLLLGRKLATERVAAFLSRFASQLERTGDDRLVVRLLMTRQDLADYLGLTLESASRALSRPHLCGFITPGTPQELSLERPRELAALANAA